MGRGQVTLFVIMGIVVVFVIGLALLIHGLFVENGLTGADAGIAEFQKSVDGYVTNCLLLVGNEAIVKVGEQGGDLYDVDCHGLPCTIANAEWVERSNVSPPGSAGMNFLPHVCNGRTCYVSYGILRNRAPPRSFSWSQGDYPVSDYDFSKEQNLTYYGDNVVRKLCDWEGANARNAEHKMATPCDLEAYDRVYPSHLKNFSIQEQLAVYVNEHMGSCVQLESYVKKGLDFTIGMPNTTVTLGDSDVTFSLEYPINMSGLRNASSKSVKFTAVADVRLKAVYEYVYRLIDADITDLDFNLTVDGAGSPLPSNQFREAALGFDPAFRFKKIRNACSGCSAGVGMDDAGVQLCPPGGCKPQFDDIIEIVDTASLIDGKPFVFNVAVQDRRPVLDKVRTVDGVIAGSPVRPDWCSVDPFVLLLQAKDPDDEDMLTFEFSGQLSRDRLLQFDCLGNSTFAGCSAYLGSIWSPVNFPSDDPSSEFPDFVEMPGVPVTMWSAGGLPVTAGSVSVYHPFFDAPLVMSTPIRAREFMLGSKTFAVKVRDEEGLLDVQEVTYGCCNLFGGWPVASCTDSFLVNWAGP